MLMLPRPLRALFATSVLSLSLTLAPLAAQAELHQNLAPLPDDTAFAMTVKLDPGSWSYLTSKLMQVMSDKSTSPADSDTDEEAEAAEDTTEDGEEEAETETSTTSFDLGELGKTFQDELGIDPVWDVLANLGSHLSVAFHPRAGHVGEAIFSLNLRSPDHARQVLDKLYAKLMASDEAPEVVRDRFGGFTFYALDTGEDEFQRMNVTVVGQNLVGTIGPDDNLLKNILYMQTVLSDKSRFKLNNQAHFAPVRESLSGKAAWTYIDLKQIFKMVESFGDNLDDEMEEFAAIKPLMDQVASFSRGVGAGFDVRRDGIDIKTFAAPDALALSERQQAYLDKINPPYTHSLQDLLRTLPQAPMATLAGQKLDLAMSDPMPIDFDAKTQAEMDKLGTAMRTGLQQVMGLDYQQDILPYIDGRYGMVLLPGTAQAPAETSAEDASEEAPSEPQPHLVMYLGLQDDKAEAFEQLLYQRLTLDMEALDKLGETLDETMDGPVSVDVDVEINEDEEESEEPIDAVADAPTHPTLLETWNNLPIYALPIDPSLGEMMELKPVFARHGNLLLVALHPDGIKAALGEQGVDLAGREAWLRKTAPENMATYLYLNLNQIVGQTLPFLQDIVGDGEDEDAESLAELQKALEPWQAIYASSVQRPDGTEGRFMIEADMDQVDFQGLAKVLDEISSGEDNFAEARDKARISSLKANMYTLQTIVETYGVDAEGYYPASLEELQTTAEENDYWKELTNPMDEEQGTLISMEAFENGEGMPGQVVYAPETNEDGQVERYRIFGIGADGELIVGDDDSPFELNNDAGDDYEEDSYSSDSDCQTEEEPVIGKVRANPVPYVKANMHTLQTIVETYGVDWGGAYPESLAALEKEARMCGREYWKSLSNPVNPAEGALTEDLQNAKPGQVVYVPERGPHITRYWIYGVDKQGRRLNDRGAEFTLTNS
ncbi:MAG: DUF3352 domain-containing protein [Candidatus Sericytochromatia bacterium]